jgi:hypothetical protein
VTKGRRRRRWTMEEEEEEKKRRRWDGRRETGAVGWGLGGWWCVCLMASEKSERDEDEDGVLGSGCL